MDPRPTNPASTPKMLHDERDCAAEFERWVAYDIRRTKIQTALIAALSAFSGALLSALLAKIMSSTRAACCALGLVAAVCVLHYWNPPKSRIRVQELTAKSESSETALWLNAILHPLWPIVNPALLTSVGDMLEDALQATLPKLIHGVRVTDIGQGSEALRITKIRSLPGSDTISGPNEGNDYVNLEVSLAYRASPHTEGHKDRTHLHLLMQFWIAGGIVIPVWVELTGIMATARMHIQLMPDPPFFSAVSLSLLGQPEVAFKCTPLAKGFLNVMDIPGLSGWLQKAIDTAAGAYVAPRSLNLNLKTMLGKRDQMDTETLGVVVVVVKSAEGFKDGDARIFWQSKAKRRGDPFVTIGWGKWGKPVWSSRVIANEGNPYWEEAAVLLVGPSEMNAKELLRVQLRDLDWGMSNDLLGTVDLHLHQLIEGPQTLNRMSFRTDRFTDKNGNKWPGHLKWECGYFTKTTIEHHLKDVGEFKRKVERETERRLREADSVRHDEQDVERQKKADFADRSEEVIAGQPPSTEWPSGILSIRIEQITGLVVQRTRSSIVGSILHDEDDDLPSAYCTIILNHQRVYTTRPRLRSSKPFFSSGTERFIKDWRTASLIIAVRDSRMHDDDPLIGGVALPLQTLFKTRSQISNEFPLIGGIGYGRIKVSLVFRSVLLDQARLPRSLVAWDVGTLDIQPHAREGPGAHDKLPDELKSCRLVLRTLNGKGKFHAHDGGWRHKKERPVRLAVHRRAGECLVVEFKHHTRVVPGAGVRRPLAFCTLWLKDVVDREERTLVLSVWRNEHGALERARANAQPLEEDGGGGGCERLGTLELTARLWPGLSGYHKPLAAREPSVADVMQVLDATEERDEDGFAYEAGQADSSSEEEDDQAETETKSKLIHRLSNKLAHFSHHDTEP